MRNRSCRKPPRGNGTDKFAIPASTAIGPSGVKQRRKNRFSREQTKRANVSQAIWKIRFALQACDLQEWQTENQGSHRTQHRKKGQIGRESCRVRVSQYDRIPVVAVSLKKNMINNKI